MISLNAISIFLAIALVPLIPIYIYLYIFGLIRKRLALLSATIILGFLYAYIILAINKYGPMSFILFVSISLTISLVGILFLAIKLIIKRSNKHKTPSN